MVRNEAVYLHIRTNSDHVHFHMGNGILNKSLTYVLVLSCLKVLEG